MNVQNDCSKPCHDIFEKNLMNYKLVLISSTYGQGNPPDNAKEFYQYLKDHQDANYSHLDYCVFALGSKNYPNFCQCGKDLNLLLANTGAFPFMDIVCCNGDPDIDYEQWQRKLCQTLNEPKNKNERSQIIANNSKNKKCIERKEQFIKGKVLSNRFIAPFIKELCVELQEDFSYASGQFLYIKIPEYEMTYATLDIPDTFKKRWEQGGYLEHSAKNQAEAKRSYSFASCPSESRNILKFNIRIALPNTIGISGGKGSSYIFSLKKGDSIEISPAQGDFLITGRKSEKVYIGGGAGMAPLRSHIVEQLNNKTSNKISYWYGARTLQDVFYKSELDVLAQENNNFSYHLALSESENDDWSGYRGYIHEVIFEKLLKNHKKLYNVYFFLCGPPPMVAACTKMLKSLHVGDHQVFFDAF